MSNLQRDALLQQAQSLLSKSTFSKEDASRAEQLINLADRCGPQAMQLKRAAVAQAELELGIRSPGNAGASEIESEFREYLGHGQKALLSDRTRRQMAGLPETRAQGVDSGSIGGLPGPSVIR